jgi:hypothetical protein
MLHPKRVEYEGEGAKVWKGLEMKGDRFVVENDGRKNIGFNGGVFMEVVSMDKKTMI